MTSVPRGQDSSLLSQHGNYLLGHRFDYDPAVETEISNFARRDSVKCALGCEQVNGVLLACARRGADVCAKLCHHIELVPPLLFVASREADEINGWRFDANLWNPALPPAEAAWLAGRPAGFVFHPRQDLPSAP